MEALVKEQKTAGRAGGIVSSGANLACKTLRFSQIKRAALARGPFGSNLKSSSGFRMEQDEVIAPVLGKGGVIVAGIGRLVLAIADGADAAGINARLGQRLAGGQRTAFAEGAVVFFRAALV